MDCCFEPGQVLLIPADGGVESLYSVFERGEQGTPDILYSVEEILRSYRLGHADTERGLDELPKGFPRYPVLVRVPPGEERSSAVKMSRLRGITAALPNFYTRPTSSNIRYNTAYINDSIETMGLVARSPECGRGVTVAVLDSGIDSTVLDAGLAISQSQFDTDVPRDMSQGLMPYDSSGHGTIVASLIRSGAPGASILSVKVMGQRGNLMGAVAGLYVAIAAKMPDLFNLSFSLTCDIGTCAICGYPSADAPVALEQITLLFKQVDEIYRYNKAPLPLLVAAAGNLLEGSPLAIPACLPDVLAVGACNSGARPDEISEYSRYSGVPVDRFVRAPGGQDAPARCYATIDPNNEGKFNRWSEERFYGTSFSAPLVTAVAARYLCAIKGKGPCSFKSGKAIASTREFVMDCIRNGANRTFAGFDQSFHGLGLARYESSALSTAWRS